MVPPEAGGLSPRWCTPAEATGNVDVHFIDCTVVPGAQRIKQNAPRQQIDNRGATYSNTGHVYNGPVQQTVVHDKGVTYNVDKEDTDFIESLSRFVIGLLGVEKTWWVVLGSGGVGLLSFWVFLESTVLKTAALWFVVLSVVVAATCFMALQFRAQTQCRKCKVDYAVKEWGTPHVREVETKDGLRRTTTRHYRCDSCGDETERKTNQLIEPEDDDE